MDADRPVQIDVETLDRMRRTGEPLAVLDVRESWEIALCALDDHIAIPLGHLPANIDRLPKDRPLVVMCHHGMRSLRATLWLRSQGFANAVNLAGGIDAWAAAVNPKMRRY